MLTKQRYRQTLFKTLPALLVLLLFTHLKQTSGFDWRPRWTDLYLLISYGAGVPWAHWLGQRYWRRRREAKARSKTGMHSAAATTSRPTSDQSTATVTPTAPTTASTTEAPASATPQSPGVRLTWLDHVFTFCGELVLACLWLLIGGLFALIYWPVTGLKQRGHQ
ncbi:hypothetical protein [Lapidilactobacillus salsurivasis]